MAVAIFGGTFDPFHKAHKKMVKELVELDRFRAIYVIPAGFSPHKVERAVSFSSYRYQMTKLALAKYSQVLVSDYELRKQEKTYTYNTIREFREIMVDNGEEIYLVIGSDSFMSIETWFSFQKLLKDVILLVVKRPGTDEGIPLYGHQSKLEKLYQARVEFIDMKPMGVSSTAIRESIRTGNGDQGLLPAKVREFVAANKLYEDNPLEDFTDEQFMLLRTYEQKLMQLMGYPRLIHSLNVMFEAVRLAKRFGEEPWKAAVAGLLHDAAKEQDYRKFPSVLEQMDKETLANRSIIHGPVGANLVAEIFQVTDAEICKAIYYHSTLSPNPSALEKIIFLADKIEPARIFDDLSEIRKMAESDLELAILLTIDGVERSLSKNRKTIHRDTKRARDVIRKALNM